MAKVTIYTDGSCIGNPGPGGYCAILVYKGIERMISGGDLNTTSNRMELMAVIKALKTLKRPCEVKIVSDSKYVTDGIARWLPEWEKNGLSKRKNGDLWEEIYMLKKIHSVKTEWVKAHSGHKMNERCDKIAKAEAKRIAETQTL